MARARFSIGIDLGTTNCALAFVAIDGAGETEVLPIAQWDTATTLAEPPALPSFLYLPDAAQRAALAGRNQASGAWIAGLLARRQAAQTPGRVVHSAKSWLCHHATDRTQPFLPWGSDELGRADKLSPVRACALLLSALRGAWDDRFAAAGADFAFAAQEITVTVPASFDAVAQRLTLDAAAAAGYPLSVRLLEEPQAAFYRWLERHDAHTDLWRRLPEANGAPRHVLVVDVGGGTSDFSLFALTPPQRGAASGIRRVAVSEHILLGGDNIDLALAHRIEPQLTGDGGRLDGAQWAHLVAGCRDLKERTLGSGGAADEAFTVAVPARGAGLIAGSLAARITRAEIEAIVLDGFFPACAAAARPHKALAALQEWGLPFAADSAITRHLAAFLEGRPAVDVVLFNGGALQPAAVRRRLIEALALWQDGAVPLVLDNAEPQLAVARGAARYGKILNDRAQRIEAGAARAVFLAAQGTHADDAPAARALMLVCVLPRDAAPEESFDIAPPGLALRLDRPVRFEAYSSTRQRGCAGGDIVAWNDGDFHTLPPLETVAKLAGGTASAAPASVPVTLSARINDTGLLQIACVSADPTITQSWPLEFNLRGTTAAAACGPPPAPNADAAAVRNAAARIATVLRRPPGAKHKLTAARVLAGIEAIVGLARAEWNAGLVRALWPAIEAAIDCRALSAPHEEAWLQLAGFVLRPGFGVLDDPARIDGLWRLRERGLSFPGKRSKIQEYLLWRRVAGGLARARQELLLADVRAAIERQAEPPAEAIRLAGALERIGHEHKAELITRFIEAARERARAGRDASPYFAALGLLLNRTPLYAGPETVVAPDGVERAFAAFSALEWTADLQTLFLRAARVTGNRSLDLPKALRVKIAGKLEKSGVAPLRTARVRDFLPVERAEQAALFGEPLPPGLILTADG